MAKLRTIRVCWTGPAEPEQGNLLLGQSGRTAYLICRVVMIHRAMASALPRLALDVISLPVMDALPRGHRCASVFASACLPWAYTAAPDPKAPRHPSAAGTARSNALAREKADQKAVSRVKRMNEAHADRSLPEPVRRAPDKPGEDVTPRSAGEVDQAGWRDPDDTNLATATPKIIRGYRAVDVLKRMQRNGGSRISDRHVQAANKARVAHEIARLGFGSGGFDPSGGRASSGPKADHGHAARIRYQWEREFACVVRAVGPSRERMFRTIVLGNLSLAAWLRVEQARMESGALPGAAIEKLDRKIEMGRLVGILDTLVDLYQGAMNFDEMMGETM